MHDKTLTLPIHEHLHLPASQYKQKKTQTSITSPTQTHNILQHSKGKQRPLHNKHSHRPPHSHYNIHKTNMRHIHTSIVSRHLATRGNNKILRTPPPHISSYEEILPRITRGTRAELRTNKCPFLKSYLHKSRRQNTSVTTMPLL